MNRKFYFRKNFVIAGGPSQQVPVQMDRHLYWAQLLWAQAQLWDAWTEMRSSRNPDDLFVDRDLKLALSLYTSVYCLNWTSGCVRRKIGTLFRMRTVCERGHLGILHREFQQLAFHAGHASASEERTRHL